MEKLEKVDRIKERETEITKPELPREIELEELYKLEIEFKKLERKTEKLEKLERKTDIEIERNIKNI